MHPFVPEELGESFSPEEAQQSGLLPVIWDSSSKDETVAAYAQLYLKEEVQAEALVRNLPGFVRFLPLAALFHGQTIKVSNAVYVHLSTFHVLIQKPAAFGGMLMDVV